MPDYRHSRRRHVLFILATAASFSLATYVWAYFALTSVHMVILTGRSCERFRVVRDERLVPIFKPLIWLESLVYEPVDIVAVDE
jgi:hypothetical protein